MPAAPPSPDSLLQQAVRLHQQGQLEAAKAMYVGILNSYPQQFDALHLLGVIAKQQGKTEEAIALIRQALSCDPTHAAAHCNLGAALQDMQCYADALASFEHALDLQPDYAIAHNNRGNALRHLLRLDQAIDSYEQAIACKPGYAAAWRNRGIALELTGQHADALCSLERALQIQDDDAASWCAHGVSLQSLQRERDAVRSYERALALNANDALAWCNRGIALARLQESEAALHSYDCALKIRPGHARTHLYRANLLRNMQRREDAIAAYQLALHHGAEAQLVHYMLATLGEEAAPDASPAAYVRELFDQYAAHFDTHLRETLHYRTPELLSAAALSHSPQHALDILDAGCGTGMCAPYLQPRCRALTGIDLSENMLKQAAANNLYTHLVCADLHDYLPTQQAAFDLIIAADVLVYIGDLAPCLRAARSALRSGGVFAFSVEASADAGYVLRSTGRYAHAEAYLRTLAVQQGWHILEWQAQVLREEGGTAIDGYLVVMQA